MCVSSMITITSAAQMKSGQRFPNVIKVTYAFFPFFSNFFSLALSLLFFLFGGVLPRFLPVTTTNHCIKTMGKMNDPYTFYGA